MGKGRTEHGLHGCCASHRVVPGAGKKEKRGQQVSSGSWQVHCAGMVRFWGSGALLADVKEACGMA